MPQCNEEERTMTSMINNQIKGSAEAVLILSPQKEETFFTSG
jgi:hypothetical protein